MTPSQFILRVTRLNLAGKVIGTVVGLSAGVFGAVFGLLIGALVDEAVRFARDRTSLARLIEHQPAPGDEDPLPLDVALVVLVAAVRTGSEAPPEQAPGLGHDGIATVVARIAEICSLTPRRTTELTHIAEEARSLAVHTTSAALADRLRPRLGSEQRVSVVDLLLSLGAAPVRVRTVAERFAVSDEDYRAARARWRRLDAQACAVLGVDAHSSLEDIKRTYRTLAIQFHPDALIGLDDEQKRQAEEAYLRVQDAYRTILAAFE